jgi:hypothetical protein
MHNPVLSFFYQGLGMTPEQIGTNGVITTIGQLCFGPVYGYILDKHRCAVRLPCFPLFLESSKLM